MASDRQIEANRRNASLPRGPLSETAAAAISQNATKHGLTAKQIVLRHEDEAEYQELRASIVTEYQPATAQEHRLADQIAQNYWRLLRARRVETAAFENHLDALKHKLAIDPEASIDNDQGISICMSADPRHFDTLRRYEAAIERAWYRAIRELRTMQNERRKMEAPPPNPTPSKPQAKAAAHCPDMGLAAFSRLAPLAASVMKTAPHHAPIPITSRQT